MPTAVQSDQPRLQIAYPPAHFVTSLFAPSQSYVSSSLFALTHSKVLQQNAGGLRARSVELHFM